MKKLFTILTAITLMCSMFSQFTWDAAAAETAVYEFQVKTKNETYAGTDAKISYKLIGDKGESDWVVSNSAIPGNAYVQNAHDSFSLTFSKDVGTIQKIMIKSNQQYTSPDWKCDFVIVKKAGTDKSYSFVINEWFKDKSEHTYDYNANINCYQIEVETGDVNNGDSQYTALHFALIGENGKSEEFDPVKYKIQTTKDGIIQEKGGHFKKAETETLIVPISAEVGKLKGITMLMADKNNTPVWYCEQVKITNVDDKNDSIDLLAKRWVKSTDVTVTVDDDNQYILRMKMDKSGKLETIMDAMSFDADFQDDVIKWVDDFDTYTEGDLTYNEATGEYEMICTVNYDNYKASMLADASDIRVFSGFTTSKIYEMSFQDYKNGEAVGPVIKYAANEGKTNNLTKYNVWLSRVDASTTGSIFDAPNIWILVGLAVLLVGGGATVILMKKKQKQAVATTQGTLETENTQTTLDTKEKSEINDKKQ